MLGYKESSYDDYLAARAEEFNKECVPEVISVHQEYEGRNEDGTIEFSTSGEYNCQECDNDECEHWKDYNEDKYKEMIDELKEYLEEALEDDYRVHLKDIAHDLGTARDTIVNRIEESSLKDDYAILIRDKEGLYYHLSQKPYLVFREDVYILRKKVENNDNN